MSEENKKDHSEQNEEDILTDGFIDEDDFYSGDTAEEDSNEHSPEPDLTKESHKSTERIQEQKAQEDTLNDRERIKKAVAAKKRLRKVLAWIGGIIGGILVIAVISFMVIIAGIPKDTISQGIYVNNLNLGGLTYEEAVASIQNTFIYENQQITLTSNGKHFTINGVDVDMEAIPEKTAQRAMEYAKSGNKLKDGWDTVKLKFNKKIVLNPIPEINTEKLDTKLNEFGVIACGELKGHSVEYKEGAQPILIVVPGNSGYDGNPAQAREQVLEALSKDQTKDIAVTFSIERPHDLTVEELGNTVYKDPKDAYFTVENGTLKTVPEENGRYIEASECEALVSQVVEGGPNIEMPYHISYPNMTASQLQAKLYNATLSTYSTKFGAGGNRGANVALAASKINGTVILPGETFSFNKTVGKRTAANGFQPAPEYLNGETVQGIGGGTCQVSTTLYSAVLYANLKIVERTNHSMSVSYVPLGQDATVSDGGLDFKFKNDTGYPVKIQAGTNGGTLTISIIGTQPEPPVKVELSHSKVSSGATTVIKSTRTVTNANTGEVIKTESLGTSRYKPHA